MMRKVQALSVAFILFLMTSLGAQAATVVVTVNGVEVTDLQVSARAGLLRLEGRGTSNNDRLKKATQELIDEVLMLGDATRIGVSVTNSQVDQAFLDIARKTQLSSDKLEAFLLDRGVPPQTLKDRLKANIAWNEVAQAVVAPQVNVSDLELEEKAQAELTEEFSYDYILKEIRFIVPQGSKVSASSRTAQANQYRKSYQGCDSAIDLSMSYTDVAVIDIGRRHSTQLPEAFAKELAGLNVGDISKPRVAEGGVSMLAVCAKASARDTTFIKDEMRQEVGTEAFKQKVDAYLETLRARATIIFQ